VVVIDNGTVVLGWSASPEVASFSPKCPTPETRQRQQSFDGRCGLECAGTGVTGAGHEDLASGLRSLSLGGRVLRLGNPGRVVCASAHVD